MKRASHIVLASCLWQQTGVQITGPLSPFATHPRTVTTARLSPKNVVVMFSKMTLLSGKLMQLMHAATICTVGSFRHECTLSMCYTFLTFKSHTPQPRAQSMHLQILTCTPYYALVLFSNMPQRPLYNTRHWGSLPS